MSQTLSRILDDLERDGRYAQLKEYRQHGVHTVYDHSLNVARASLRMAERLPFRLDREALVRGALLHDYFLYDWHKPDPNRPNHAFYHPKMAWENARRDYALGETEKDIIRHHMFPMVPIPPHTREGWIVCAMDKVCALRETLFRSSHRTDVDQSR